MPSTESSVDAIRALTFASRNGSGIRYGDEREAGSLLAYMQSVRLGRRTETGFAGEKRYAALGAAKLERILSSSRPAIVATPNGGAKGMSCAPRFAIYQSGS